jgi:hypothetical protein
MSRPRRRTSLGQRRSTGAYGKEFQRWPLVLELQFELQPARIVHTLFPHKVTKATDPDCRNAYSNEQRMAGRGTQKFSKPTGWQITTLYCSDASTSRSPGYLNLIFRTTNVKAARGVTLATNGRLGGMGESVRAPERADNGIVFSTARSVSLEQ